MTFKIAEWTEGDDPQLVIAFINEVMNDLLPSYSEPGWYTPEQEEQILKKYSPNNGIYESFTFYDGKILHVEYTDVQIDFAKMDAALEFTFENICIGFYEDYSYGTGKIYNSSNKTARYNSIYPGFEDLLKIKGIDTQPITVTVKKNPDE